MVKAILEGRKTQTRRIIKDSYNGCLTNGGPHPCPNEPVVMHPGAVIQSPIEGEPDIVIDGDKVHAHFFCSTMDKAAYCPYGKVGDILYVRETSAVTYSTGPKMKRTVWYKADDPVIPPNVSFKWKPSIHMLRGSARIFLKITDIRVEALRDINWADAFAEGILKDEIGFKNYDKELAKGYGHPDHDYPHLESAIDSFKSLWQSINGPDSWKENPWVWVINFERTNKPEVQ